jgi:hypothetical protein
VPEAFCKQWLQYNDFEQGCGGVMHCESAYQTVFWLFTSVRRATGISDHQSVTLLQGGAIDPNTVLMLTFGAILVFFGGLYLVRCEAREEFIGNPVCFIAKTHAGGILL